MKNAYFFLLATACFLSACQQKTTTKPAEPEAIKAEINEVMDTYNAALNAKDASTVLSLMGDDVLFLGTDPSEYLDKKAISDLWALMAADTVFAYNLSVDRREVRPSENGNSAIVVEQYLIPLISEKIPLRVIYHVVKTDNGWVFDFVSGSFIPKNEDIAALNNALE